MSKTMDSELAIRTISEKVEEIIKKTYGIEIITINGCILVPLYQVEDKLKKLNKIEQIVKEWNNDASHSFSDMCKINEILK